MSIANAFNGVFALMLIMLLGAFMTRRKFLTEDYYHFLTSFIMKYTIPAMLFENAIENVTMEFITENGTLLLAPFVTQLGGYLIALGIAKLIKLPKSLEGIFISIFAMCNTMLMGFPICMQIFGEVSVPYVTAYYIANTLVFWILVRPPHRSWRHSGRRHHPGGKDQESLFPAAAVLPGGCCGVFAPHSRAGLFADGPHRFWCFDFAHRHAFVRLSSGQHGQGCAENPSVHCGRCGCSSFVGTGVLRRYLPFDGCARFAGLRLLCPGGHAGHEPDGYSLRPVPGQ